MSLIDRKAYEKQLEKAKEHLQKPTPIKLPTPAYINLYVEGVWFYKLTQEQADLITELVNYRQEHTQRRSAMVEPTELETIMEKRIAESAACLKLNGY